MGPLFDLTIAAARVPQTAVEGTGLAWARTVFGDEQVADWLFDLPYNPGFVGRHTNQLSSLYVARFIGKDVVAELEDN